MKTINVVAAYIVRNANFLITRRAKGELKGSWEFPGGKIEKNETSKDAIIREIKEELGLNINPVKELAEFKHNYPHADISLLLIMCELENENPLITFDGSHDNFKWIKLHEVDNYKFAPLDIKIVAFLKKEYK